MFERFTERARRVMSYSRQEAQRLNHDHIGSEHLLLGIVLEGGGVAAKVLANLNVDLKRIRVEIEKVVAPSPPAAMMLTTMPFSPRAKRVIELASETAGTLGHDRIGTEHLLLGLLQEVEGIAAKVLHNLGLRFDEVRDTILQVLALSPVRGPGLLTAERLPHLNERDLHLWAERYRALTDRPGIQSPIAALLQQGRSIALVGPSRVGKTSLIMALSRSKAASLAYWSIDYRMFDEFYASELARIRRPGTVCIVSEGELLTASRSVDAGLLSRRMDGGERLILEFREGGLEKFAERYPALAKELETVVVPPPPPEECLQLAKSARLRLMQQTGLNVSNEVLHETERLAREKWPLMVQPWPAVITLWKAATIQMETQSRTDVFRLQKDEADLLSESVRVAIAELSGPSAIDLK